MTDAAQPYAAASWPPPLPPPLPEAVEGCPAGICSRAMAFLVDIVFLAGLQGMSGLAAGRLLFSGVQQDPQGFFASTAGAFFLLFVAPSLIGLCYFSILHAYGGQTLGKLFLGLRVIGHDGGPVSLGGAFLRTVGYVVSLFPFGAGFLWAVLAKKHETWHDYLACTRVVQV